MRLGVHYANFGHPGGPAALTPRLAETARVADQGGVAILTVMDHWFQMESLGGPAEPMLEGYTTLGYLAAVTERLRLSLLVTGDDVPAPGAARQDRDHPRRALRWPRDARHRCGLVRARAPGLGVPFPPTAERFERLEETLQICRQMWSATTARSRVSTTGWPRRSACRSRSSSRGRRS